MTIMKVMKSENDNNHNSNTIQWRNNTNNEETNEIMWKVLFK